MYRCDTLPARPARGYLCARLNFSSLSLLRCCCCCSYVLQLPWLDLHVTHSVPMLLNLAIVEPPQITALDEDCLALAVDPSEHHTMCDKKVSIKIWIDLARFRHLQFTKSISLNNQTKTIYYTTGLFSKISDMWEFHPSAPKLKQLFSTCNNNNTPTPKVPL